MSELLSVVVCAIWDGSLGGNLRTSGVWGGGYVVSVGVDILRCLERVGLCVCYQYYGRLELLRTRLQQFDVLLPCIHELRWS